MIEPRSRFLAFPVRAALRHAPRSPGVVSIVAITLSVVALDSLFPAVGHALEARSDAFAAGQYWRLMTYVFPHHGGFLHALLNMGLLCLYGWQLERIVGTARFVVGYLAAGAIGMALLSSFRTIDSVTGLTGGASLAVFSMVVAIGVLYASAGALHRKDAVRAAITIVVLIVVSGVVSMARRGGGGGVLFGVVNHSLAVVSGVLVGLGLHWSRNREIRRQTGVQ